MRIRNMKEDMAEDRHLWRLGMDPNNKSNKFDLLLVVHTS